jgi:anti-sigma factor RsiW
MANEQMADNSIAPADLHECRRVVEVVDDWLDHELSMPMRAAVELHLAVCAGCVAYVEQARGTRRAVAGLREKRPDEATRGLLVDLFRKRDVAG